MLKCYIEKVKKEVGDDLGVRSKPNNCVREILFTKSRDDVVM